MAVSSHPVHVGEALSATKRASELALRQSGPIARWQLLQLGCGRNQIAGWIGTLLHRRYPGVYAWGRPELSARGDLVAGLLFTGLGSALGGLTCLWWRGHLNNRPDLIHIDAPGRKASRQDLLIRHPRRIERGVAKGLPVAPLAPALLASAPYLKHNSLRLVLARAEFARELDLPALEAELGRGVAGTRALRAAMDAHLPQLARCRNPFERDFVLLCESHGVPIPEPNVRIGRFVPDMFWEGENLIVELDGKGAHTTSAQRIADAERQRWLEERGYRVIRFTWAQVQFQAGWVAATVRAALAGA